MANETTKKSKGASTQQFLPIQEVKEGVLKMKNGSLRAVIIVSSVNFQLKSEREKDAMIASYQNFLNSLSFPMQIMAQSRKTQLDEYLNKLRSLEENETNSLLQLLIGQYITFVGGLIEESNIMAKRFYVIVPFYPSGIEQANKANFIKKFFSPSKESSTDFETQKMELMQRVEQAINGLSGIGLRCVVLNTEDLIELYYSVYNPDMTQSEKLADADELESSIISGGGEKHV